MSKLAMTGKGFVVRVCSTYCMRVNNLQWEGRGLIFPYAALILSMIYYVAVKFCKV